MNIFIAILLLFALLGAVDKMIGGRLGVADEFDRGLATMGSLALSMAGIYCIAVTALGQNPQMIASLSKVLPFDASLLAGALLAPDLGGYAIAAQLAATPALAAYTGLMVASTLGCLISFVLPVSLGSLRSHEIMGFMQGILWGVIAMPIGILAAGMMLQLPFDVLLANLWPVAALCALLCITLRFAPKATIVALSLLGQVVRIGGIILFCIVAAGVFVPQIAQVPEALVFEVLVINFKITVIVCGSMVLSRIVLARCGRFVSRVAALLGVNDYAVVGLLMSLATSISMLPLYPKMDVRGKVMNAAFAVSGAFVFGGQLAFVSSVADGSTVLAFMVCKLLGGIAAVFLAGKFTQKSAACV